MPQISSETLRETLEPAIIRAWQPTKIYQLTDLEEELPQGDLPYVCYHEKLVGQNFSGPLATVTRPQLDYEVWLVGVFRKAQVDTSQQAFRAQMVNAAIRELEDLGPTPANQFNFPLSVEGELDNAFSAGEGAFTVAIRFTCSESKEFGS